MKKKYLHALAVLLIIVSGLLCLLYFYLKPIYEDDIFKNIEVLSYDESSNDAVIKIILNDSYNDLKCGYSKSISNSNIKYKDIKDDVCTLNINLKKFGYIHLKRLIFNNSIKMDNLVFDINTFDKIYLAVGEEFVINPVIKIFGDNYDVSYKAKDSKIVDIDGNKITGKKIGKTKLEIYVNDKKEKEIDIDVTGLINKRSKKFDKNRSYLPCNKYSLSEAEKLDDILETKIKNVGGYGTRAAVVEAMRFLLLDFKYRIDYFFENGRLTGGMNYADGEGRYYHKGLYLHESKFNDIEASFAGPAIWGCPLRNFEDYPPKYIRGSYNDNGLDCSGFVSWTIYNGGFDVGDRGAGDNLEDINEINDVGDKRELTDELIKSGEVKAGDLLGIWGHIAIIIGIDDENVYVAESLWTYGGVVINTYKIDELDEEFVQVVLMDKVYKEDGLYTDMWY